MLNVRELEANVWELTLNGVVDKCDIKKMEHELSPVLQGEGPLGLIVRAEGLKDLTADAMAEDAKFEIGMMAHWRKVARMAVVSDLQALAALIKWVNPILPMIDMRSFGSGEIAAAEAFAADLRHPRQRQAGNGIRLLEDGANGVIAYEIDGRITNEDVAKLIPSLEAHMAGSEKINLLIRFRSFDGFDPAILMNGSLIGSKLSAIAHLRRYAVIGAPKWMAAMAGAAGALMPFEMKMFDAGEDAAAWTWVRDD